jgi:hypothetical protein
MIDATPVSSRQKMVFESGPGLAVTWASGPSGKAYVTRWTKRGYATTMRLVSAAQVGGAVAQARFLVTPLASILSPLCPMLDHCQLSSRLLVSLPDKKDVMKDPPTHGCLDGAHAAPCWRLDS